MFKHKEDVEGLVQNYCNYIHPVWSNWGLLNISEILLPGEVKLMAFNLKV